jgi:hypothetical protein
MSPRLRATLLCKADALETRERESLSRVTADRCTSKRVKHFDREEGGEYKTGDFTTEPEQ